MRRSLREPTKCGFHWDWVGGDIGPDTDVFSLAKVEPVRSKYAFGAEEEEIGAPLLC